MKGNGALRDTWVYRNINANSELFLSVVRRRMTNNPISERSEQCFYLDRSFITSNKDRPDVLWGTAIQHE